MALLAFGVLLFAVLHLVSAVPGLKQAFKSRLGERAFGPAYGLASLLALAIIVVGWRRSDFEFVYDPPAWGAHANFAFTLVAFLCFGIFLFRGSWRQRLRFPMGLAVIFWATGHLLANGDLSSVILFGGMLAYALVHIGLGLASGARPSPEVRGGHNLAAMLAGLALYGVMTQLHPYLIGVPVLTLIK
jgi:uncharacterized membrane protein